MKHHPPRLCPSHPAGHFGSMTDAVGGFKGRRTLTLALMPFAHVFYKITRNMSSFAQYQRKMYKRSEVRESCNDKKKKNQWLV